VDESVSVRWLAERFGCLDPASLADVSILPHSPRFVFRRTRLKRIEAAQFKPDPGGGVDRVGRIGVET